MHKIDMFRNILRKGHQYGPTEQIMDILGYARKSNIMNTKESYYIYQFKQPNVLTEERKSIKDNDNQNNMFDIEIGYEYTPTGASQGTRV
jgi:hypothetical protein